MKVEQTPLLDVRGLATVFPTSHGVVRAVDDVSFTLSAGETLGLVGESGCGKSVTALSIVRLVPKPGRTTAGSAKLDGVDLLALADEEMRIVRGRKIGFIFQDPMTSLNPVLTVGKQIAERARHHMDMSSKEAGELAVELLSKVRIPNARSRASDYPHEFSGGMRQRVMIAIALAGRPSLIIADEPTTALDVTIQAQVLDLIRSLSADMGTAVILITHDLGIAAGMCDRINIMYAGRIVEAGPVHDLFRSPQMPYTRGLLDSVPRISRSASERLRSIEGTPPDLIDAREMCRFSPRCSYVRDRCLESEPLLTPRGDDHHRARCWATEPDGWLV